MYDYTLTLRDRKLKFRKWKVKDKNKFLEATRNNDKALIKESLVYDCLEKSDIALSESEFKYVLVKIRQASIGDTASYNLQCSGCDQEFVFESNLDIIVKPSFEKYGTIKYNNVSVKMGNIANKKYYDEIIDAAETKEQVALMNFLMHIKELNDSDAFSFDQLIDFFNELEIDTAEGIFNQWDKMQFTLDILHDVECPNCGYLETYEFDFLPGFFPENWFKG